MTPCIALYGSNGTSTTNIGAPAANAYRVTITAKGGNTFSIDRASTGVVAFPCTVAVSTNRGGCPSSGRWN